MTTKKINELVTEFSNYEMVEMLQAIMKCYNDVELTNMDQKGIVKNLQSAITKIKNRNSN